MPDGLRTRWLRYPGRDPAANFIILQQGHVHLSRADWVNRGSVPVYLSSRSVSPVCVRLQYQFTPKHFTDRLAVSPSENCPTPWGELQLGGGAVVQMEFPEYPGSVASFHLDIRPVQASMGKEAKLPITDARRLPTQRKDSALKLDGMDMRVP